jgi:hypothetical protein
MQRIYPCELTVEQYVASEAHRQVVAESVCPQCGLGRGTRRARELRAVGDIGNRGGGVDPDCPIFCVRGCGRTVSYLPSVRC